MMIYAAMLGVFFAGGLGVSMVLLKSRLAAEQPEVAEATEDPGAAGTLDVGPDGQPLANPDALAMGTTLPPVTDPNAPDASTTGDLPKAVRGAPMSPEEIYRYGEIFKKQREQLDAREEALRVQANRLRMMQEDLENSKRELEGMRQDLNDTIAVGEKILSELEQNRQQAPEATQTEPATPPEQAAPTEEDKSANVKQLGEMFSSMKPEDSARNISQMVAEGKLEEAVKILSAVEASKAAKIVAACESDYGLKLIYEVMNQKRENKKR
jgi:flagellar motility protein MotE (MotC chaperone)